MKKYILAITLALILSLNLTGCSQRETPEALDPSTMAFEDLLLASKSTTVNFYMWGGDPRINKWVDDFVAVKVKNLYGITLNRVPMNAEDFMSKLISEKTLPANSGSIDLLWINGENFFTAKENNLLYGPFVNQLPNYKTYLDGTKKENSLDFGYENQGYEVPYGRAQLVFVYDSAFVKTPPKSLDELVSFIKQNPGKFTYPAPPDFTGSAFVRNVMYNKSGGSDKFMSLKPSEIAGATQETWQFLNDLKPYLWREGKTYPSNIAQLDTMLSDGEVWMSMTYMPLKPAGDILKGVYPKTVKTFVIEEGTISNTHFLAIPQNGKNKSGALVVANYLTGFDAQLSKLDPNNWGDLPVFDYNKLSAQEKDLINGLDLGSATLSQEILTTHRVPEIPGALVPVIEEEWMKNVAQ